MVLDFLENIQYKDTYNIIDINGKVYDFKTNKIYFDDNVNTVSEKIAYFCNEKIKVNEIYIWYYDKNIHKSLYFDYVSNDKNIIFTNPLDDIPDINFLDGENFSSKTTIYNNKCINNIDIKDNNIYFITIHQLIDNKDINIDKRYINGLIKKYFPNLNDKEIKDFINKKKITKKISNEIDKQIKCLNIIDKQCKFIYNKDLNSNVNSFLFKFIKINNNDNKNNINIIKIFAKLQTNIDIPFIKLYLNNSTESYYKLYNEYYKKNIVDSTKIISWIKSKTLNIKNSLYYISEKNTLTIYFKYNNIYFGVMICIDGNVSLIIDEDIDSDNLNKIIKICNDFIKYNINNVDIYSVEDIRYIDFEWSKKHIYDNHIELFDYNLYFRKTENFDKKSYINFINNLYIFFRPINERTSIKSDMFYYIFKRVNDYDEKNIEELLYYKYKNPPYNLDDKEIIKKISDDLLTKENELESRITTYRENYDNKRRYNKNSIGPEIIISFNTNDIIIEINSVKSIDEYYRLYKIFTNINYIYNDKNIEKNEYLEKNKNLNFYKKECINITTDIYLEDSDIDSDDDILRFLEMDEENLLKVESDEIKSPLKVESDEIKSPLKESDEIKSPPTVESDEIKSPPTVESDEIKSPLKESDEIKSPPTVESDEIKSPPTVESDEIKSPPTVESATPEDIKRQKLDEKIVEDYDKPLSLVNIYNLSKNYDLNELAIVGVETENFVEVMNYLNDNTWIIKYVDTDILKDLLDNDYYGMGSGILNEEIVKVLDDKNLLYPVENGLSPKTQSYEPSSKESSKSKEKIVVGSKVEFIIKDKKIIGVVEKETPKKYKICCKPGKTSGEKGSIYMVDKDNVKLLKQSGRGYTKQNGGGENLDRYYTKRLKDYDKKLFTWKGVSDGVKRVQYSKNCDSTTQRQPIVVTDEELKRINMSEDLGSGRKSYSNVLKYGSDPNHQYNYICPQYWDTKNNLSLDPNSDVWDRNQIIQKSDNIKNTDKTILQRNNKFWTMMPPIVKDAKVKNPDLDLPVPCCFLNLVKDVNVETNVITQNTLCFKNYCKLNEKLDKYLNSGKENDNDKIFLKKGIGEHSILDALIYILNISEIINIDEMLKDSNIDNDYIETFFDDIKVKNKIYTSDILDYDIVKYNILNYFKIKTFNKSLKISILKYSLLLNYFEKIKNTKYDDFDRNVIRKCIDIEKNNFSNEKCIICKFKRKDNKEIIGVVEKITPEEKKRKEGELPKSYRVCCKPDTNYYDKNYNLWSIPYKQALKQCTEYDPEEKCKEYGIDLNDIQNGIEYYNTILNNIDSVYNSFVLYIKRYIFKKKLIQFVKTDNFGKSGNGFIVDKFKKYKKNITNEDIEKYNKFYNKNYKDIDDMYRKFEKDLESYNNFNVFTASQKYIEYLETSKYLDDLYILPVMQSYLKSIGKNIYTIVFEDIQNECCIKNQYYDLNDNDEYIFFYKNGKDYEPICFKNGKKNKYIFDIKDIKFVIDDVIKNDNKISNLIDAKTMIKKFNINGAFINNNFMTHLITDKNIFIPIQKCYIEDVDLNLVFDIKNIDLPDYKEIKKFYKNPLLEKYIPENIIVEDETYTLVFSNKSYIPIKKDKFDISVTEGKNLFELDKQICLQNVVIDKNLEYIDNINLIIENIEEYIGYMLVEFKNKNKRYLDVKNINSYKIENKYKGETITNILITDILQNIGIIYTYDNILKDIDHILKNKDLDIDKKHLELYDRLKEISNKNIKKCKNIDLIQKKKLLDVFLYRFIELLCIYGINKNERKNIYNCQKDIELHLLYMTTKKDETFLSYTPDIVEIIESLYDNDNIY